MGPRIPGRTREYVALRVIDAAVGLLLDEEEGAHYIELFYVRLADRWGLHNEEEASMKMATMVKRLRGMKKGLIR